VSFINTGKLSGVACYALDLWVEQWRRRNGHGDIIIVRYADDFVLGFEHHLDAQRFLKELRERLARFKLELHPEKTRLLRFGRFASAQCRRVNDAMPRVWMWPTEPTRALGESARQSVWAIPLRPWRGNSSVFYALQALVPNRELLDLPAGR